MLNPRHAAVLVSAVLAASGAGTFLHALTADRPETMMITLRAKTGGEEALAEVIARHFETARKLNLLREASPHVTLRGADAESKTYFVEIFTWRDIGIPDAAPAAIQSIWREMNALVEARGGRPGLEFTEVTIVAP